MIKYLFSFLMALLFAQVTTAQDSIRVYDWSVVVTPIEVKQEDKMKPKQPTEAEVKILFKVDDVSKADKVYIKVGNKQGSDNYKNEVLKVEKVNDGYQLREDENKVFKVWGKSLYYTFNIPIKDSEKVKYTTIYLKTKSGNITDKHSIKSN